MPPNAHALVRKKSLRVFAMVVISVCRTAKKLQPGKQQRAPVFDYESQW